MNGLSQESAEDRAGPRNSPQGDADIGGAAVFQLHDRRNHEGAGGLWKDTNQ